MDSYRAFLSDEKTPDDVYYQILLVEYSEPNPPGRQCIKSTVITKTRGKFRNFKTNSFSNTGTNNIGSQLPSPGVSLSTNFLEALFGKEPIVFTDKITQITNFHDTARRLLIARKLSQLISKTWHSYLIAKKKNVLWTKFIEGQWGELISNSSEVDGILPVDILNGLIARDIFLSDYRSAPIKIEVDDPSIYHQLYFSLTEPETRFIILPSNRAWQNIALSLLLAGQAYYKFQIENQDYYYQICPPIFSTAEIVVKFGIDISLNQFTGFVTEVIVSPDEYSIHAPLTIPYPPIPSEDNLPFEHIRRWAYAEDEGGEFPFYSQSENKYFPLRNYTPPFPYIPMSCSS